MNAVVYVVGNGCLEKTGLNPSEEHGAAGIPNFIKAIVKILGTTIRNCTNSVTRLTVFSPHYVCFSVHELLIFSSNRAFCSGQAP